MARSFSGREARFGTLAVVSVVVVLAILVAINYLGVAAQQALGPDRRASSSRCRTRPGRSCEGLQKPVAIKVFAPTRTTSSASATGSTNTSTRRSRSRSSTSTSIKPPSPRPSSTRCSSSAPSSFEYDGRTERVTSDGEQELTNGLIKVVQGTAAARSTSSRVTARRARTAPIATATARSRRSLGARTSRVDKVVLAQQKDVPGGRLGAGHRRPEDRLLRARDRHAQALPGEGRQDLLPARSAGQAGQRPSSRTSSRCSRTGGSTSATTSSSTSAAWASCSAPGRKCRSPPSTSRTRSPSASTC